jgi:hypothetical protein
VIVLKFINLLRLQLNSKKKSIGDRIFYLNLRTTAITLAVAMCIIVITSQYHIPFRDVLVITIILFAITLVVVSVANRYIINRYFEPLQTLINSVNRISDSDTLSKRINVEISGNKNAEVEIQMIGKTFNRMFNRLEKSFENEKQFARNISHEIKTPLAVIISNCEYAQDFTDDPQEMRETLEAISTQANRISDITSKLSALAKLDGVNQKLDYEDFCINELLQITIDEVLIEYESLGKNISINIHADENIMVHADRIMLVRLFINLLSNSVKYGSQGGATDIYLKKMDNILQCNIFDNGIGISKDDLNEVWKPFFRVDRSNSNSNGLGLPMVKKIVSVHNGSIRMDSTLGEGTRFYISLPIAL